MKIRDFSTHISIVPIKTVIDDAGGSINTPINLERVALYANIEDLSSNDDYVEGTKQLVNRYRITVRFNPDFDITRDLVISYGDNSYVINSIVRKTIGKMKYIEMICESTDSQIVFQS